MNVKSIIVLVLVLLIANANIAQACEPDIPKHPFRDSKIVFFGEFVESTETNDRCSRVVKFKVEQYWKGKPAEYVTLETPTTLCCGFNFRVGEKYLVYAYPEESSRLETSVGWVLADDLAEERIKKLGKGKVLESKTPSQNNGLSNKSMDARRGSDVHKINGACAAPASSQPLAAS